eukprot:4467117-Amphidinium_carterae.2
MDNAWCPSLGFARTVRIVIGARSPVSASLGEAMAPRFLFQVVVGRAWGESASTRTQPKQSANISMMLFQEALHDA